MGNCQAGDTASLVIQHPSGKSEILLWPIPASQVMKANPGHYVALLIDTTTTTTAVSSYGADRSTVRITRVKLLKPTDTLLLGHVYRLITTQEVMKELVARKQAKMKQGDGVPEISMKKALNQRVESKADMVGGEARSGSGSGSRLKTLPTTHLEKSSNMGGCEKRQKQKSLQSSASRCKAWQPSLKSISEQSPKAHK